MQPARLPPVSPHPTRTSPIRHGKRFGSLTVPEEHREAALKGEGTDLKNQKNPRTDSPRTIKYICSNLLKYHFGSL